MQMRKFAQFAILAIAIALTGSGIAAAQADGLQHHKRTVGYMDERGVFHAAHAVPEAATSETLTGTLEVTLNITVKSSFPKGYVLGCQAFFGIVSSSEASPNNPIGYSEDSATTTTTTTCTVIIPYSWIVNSPSTTVINTMTGSYSVYAVNPAATGPALGLDLRLVGGDIVDTTTLPANGATTKYTIAVTI